MAYYGPVPLPIPVGGTGVSTLPAGILIGNGTSPLTSTTVDQYAVLAGGASNAIHSIDDVAVGQVLVSKGTMTYPGFASNSTVGSWQLIAQNTPSGVATSTFAISASYNNYVLLITSLSSTMVGKMQAQIDTGSGAITSGYFGGANESNSTSASLSNESITSGLLLSTFDATTDFVSGIVYLSNLTSGTNYVMSYGNYNQYNTSGPGMKFGITCGSYNTASQTAVNLVISCTAGNITGTMTLYGLAES